MARNILFTHPILRTILKKRTLCIVQNIVQKPTKRFIQTSQPAHCVVTTTELTIFNTASNPYN